jgi:hypothetical protein
MDRAGLSGLSRSPSALHRLISKPTFSPLTPSLGETGPQLRHESIVKNDGEFETEYQNRKFSAPEQSGSCMKSWSHLLKILIATTAFASVGVRRRYLTSIRKEGIFEGHESHGMDKDRLAANVPLAMILACKVICPESLMRCRLDGSLYNETIGDTVWITRTSFASKLSTQRTEFMVISGTVMQYWIEKL